MTTCRSDTCRPPRGDRGVTDLPLLRPTATATMWEIRSSPLGNNLGNRPRIYVGYNNQPRRRRGGDHAQRSCALAGAAVPLALDQPPVGAYFHLQYLGVLAACRL